MWEGLGRMGGHEPQLLKACAVLTPQAAPPTPWAGSGREPADPLGGSAGPQDASADPLAGSAGPLGCSADHLARAAVMLATEI